MEPSEVSNVEGTGQNQNVAPEPTNPVGPQVIPDAIISIDAIVKSMLQTDVMKEKFVSKYGIRKEDQAIVKLRNIIDEKKVAFNDPTVVFHIYYDIMESLDPWNTFFKLSLGATKTCVRCRTDGNYPVPDCYGVCMIANTLRDIKSAFGEFTFENIFKVIVFTCLVPCNNKECQQVLYVDRVIEELPSVFTIALYWQYNESGKDIRDTMLVLKTDIDITAMYKWEGKSGFVNYRLVSMVCQLEDQYFRVAYEQGKWVRLVGSEKQVIGDDWMSVVRTFVSDHTLPLILFFEQDTRTTELKIKNARKSSVDPKSKGKAIEME